MRCHKLALDGRISVVHYGNLELLEDEIRRTHYAGKGLTYSLNTIDFDAAHHSALNRLPLPTAVGSGPAAKVADGPDSRNKNKSDGTKYATEEADEQEV